MSVRTVQGIGTDGKRASLEGWQWFFGVCRSVFTTTPGHAIACVLLYIASHLALLAALLLPWKLLIVLSANVFPRIMPVFLANYETRELVLILSVASLASFLTHLICEGGISMVCGRGAQSVIDLHQKTGLFNSHREQAAQLYRRMLQSLAALVCCVLVMLWLTLAYPLLLIALASYLGFGLVAALRWSGLRVRAEYRPSRELVMKAWWGGGFLYMLGWVIADYWRGELPGLTIAFISLVLVRQTLVFIATVYQNLRLLQDNRGRVDALFLAEMPWLPRLRRDDGFQGLLEPTRRTLWVSDLLRAHGLASSGELDILCRSAQAGRIIYMTVINGRHDEPNACLLKLYHGSLYAVAQHEREVLQAAEAWWPAPRLLGDHTVDGNTCLAFDWSADKHWLTARERRSCLRSLRGGLMTCELPNELLARYDRSQPRLSRRLENVDWALLRSLAPSREVASLCNALQSHWAGLLRELDALPRHLVLPALDRRMMGAAGNEPATICNWTRWRWESIGAGWPFRTRSREQLGEFLLTASAVRDELRAINSEAAFRVAMLYEFEHLHASRNFAAALALVAPICESAALSA